MVSNKGPARPYRSSHRGGGSEAGEGKRQCRTWIGRRGADSRTAPGSPLWQRQSLPWHFFIRPVISTCLAPSPLPLHLRILRVHTRISGKVDFTERACRQNILDETPLWPPRSLFCRWPGRSPGREKKRVWSGRGPASSLGCPAILVLSWRSQPQGMSPITLP